MLGELDLNRRKLFQDFKVSELGERFARLQRICESMDIPILIIVDGWESSGKGYVINDLVRELNPKFFDVEVFERSSEEDLEYPFMRKFWIYTPKKGHVKVFDRSFYYELMDNIDIEDEELCKKVDSIKGIEKTLYDDKTIILKFFLDVSKEVQKERINEMKNSEMRSFYIDIHDIDQNENYKNYKKHFEHVLKLTNFRYTPWNIINSDDRKAASKEALGLAIEEVQKGIERVATQRENGIRIPRDYVDDKKILENLDLNKNISDEEYDQLENLQKEVSEVFIKYHNRNIPIVLVFEGVDAAGKDGAISRLIRRVDPRLYKVHAISAPDEGENARNYLWRFYTKIPKNGYASIFSRSWYGRVMVERVEGFATVREWERAYSEMLEMERQIYSHGGLVIKFFVAIDKDT
ncbi:MAG: hypothetical protein GXY89_03070, partial [Tissierellia bacterium]|nr:hypothetical protein [Tissierellia bacterium]